MYEKKITVLDNGFVEYVSHMGSDITVVNAARVSFNKTTLPTFDKHGKEIVMDKDFNLIKYLAQHDHWTPFAHPQITLRIKAPISIRTQCFKHKQGFVENEISRRYVTIDPEFYYPEWRTAPKEGAKQGSSDFMKEGTEKELAKQNYSRAAKKCLSTYEDLIKSGVAPEQARFILPQGTYTEWWWTGSLAAYGRFFMQRTNPHAQWEIREFAGAMYDLVKPLFPEACSAFEDYAVNSVKLSAGEYDLVKNLISKEKWATMVTKYGNDEKALGQDAGLGVRELKEFKEKLGL